MSAPTPADDPPASLERPGEIADRWADAWNDRDADRLAALFDADAEFVNVTGLWWHDREAIRKAHAYGLNTIFSDSTVSIVRRTVKWLVGAPDTPGPAVAVVHAKMRLEGQTPVGDVHDPRPRQTLFSFVMHRTDGRWRCASAHNTDVVPGSETHVRDADGRLHAVSYRSGQAEA